MIKMSWWNGVPDDGIAMRSYRFTKSPRILWQCDAFLSVRRRCGVLQKTENMTPQLHQLAGQSRVLALN